MNSFAEIVAFRPSDEKPGIRTDPEYTLAGFLHALHDLSVTAEYRVAFECQTVQKDNLIVECSDQHPSIFDALDILYLVSERLSFECVL